MNTSGFDKKKKKKQTTRKTNIKLHKAFRVMHTLIIYVFKVYKLSLEAKLYTLGFIFVFAIFFFLYAPSSFSLILKHKSTEA